MNINKSLFYRAGTFSNNRYFAYLEKKYKISGTKEIGKEIIDNLFTIKAYRKKANILIDIGAYKGLFSKGANMFFDLDKVFCFEPNKELLGDIKANDIKQNCIVENIALSDKKGTADFYIHASEPMSSLVDTDNSVLEKEFSFDDPEKIKKVETNIITLDDYFSSKIELDWNFMIKIDTQGNELDILRHGQEVLKRTEICLIEFMFVTPYKMSYEFQDLVNFMSENEFDCKGALSIARRDSHKISAVDFLFVKKELILKEK